MFEGSFNSKCWGYRASQVCLFCLFPEAKDIENLVFIPSPHCLFKIRNNNSRQLPGLWAGAELILGKRLKEGKTVVAAMGFQWRIVATKKKKSGYKALPSV